MFAQCWSLEEPPIINATTTADSCFLGMFQYCYSLKHAPKLHATTMDTNCYSYMFQNCLLLDEAPELPATTLAGACYQYMFQYCFNLRTIPKELPATYVPSNAYASMFHNCANLTESPKIYAEKIESNAMLNMFYGDYLLNDVYCNVRYIGTTEITSNISSNWLYSVSVVGTYHKNPNWAGPTVRSANTVPANWTIVDWNE